MAVGGGSSTVTASSALEGAAETVVMLFPRRVLLQVDLNNGKGNQVIEFPQGVNEVNADLADWHANPNGKRGLHWYLAANGVKIQRVSKRVVRSEEFEKEHEPEPETEEIPPEKIEEELAEEEEEEKTRKAKKKSK